MEFSSFAFRLQSTSIFHCHIPIIGVYYSFCIDILAVIYYLMTMMMMIVVGSFFTISGGFLGVLLLLVMIDDGDSFSGRPSSPAL